IVSLQSTPNPAGKVSSVWSDAVSGFIAGAGSANSGGCSVALTEFSLIPGEDRAAGGLDYDYLLDVEVRSAGNEYSLMVSLQDGTTYEQISQVTQSFTSSAGAGAAGRQAATSFGSLFDRICDYWKKKRDENTENAVKPKLTIKPAQEKMNVGDSTSVEIT